MFWKVLVVFSDDRSAESFKQHIESVTQIRGSVNDSNMKPSCLIIDEIDGAPTVSTQSKSGNVHVTHFHYFDKYTFLELCASVNKSHKRNIEEE